MNDVEHDLRRFLAGFLGAREIGPKENLFAAGINSLFIMQLLAFVEQNFGVRVEDDDLEMVNFATIEAITQLVDRKRGAAVP
jgi:methoxymalonate biosynthesis acyl carrier protein